MTKDELISKQAVLDALLAKMDTIDDKPEVVLGMAVAMGMIKAMPSALEQEPCDDCISREEAIKPFLVDATEEWTSADIVKYLKSLLSVMPTMIYPQVIGITPIVVPVEEEQGDIQYDNKTTLNKG